MVAHESQLPVGSRIWTRPPAADDLRTIASRRATVRAGRRVREVAKWYADMVVSCSAAPLRRPLASTGQGLGELGQKSRFIASLIEMSPRS